MRKIITAIILFVFSQNISAQSAIEDLKFEEAETAFNNGENNTTISKLDEFDKLLGSVTAKSLYLRIVTQNAILDRRVNYRTFGFNFTPSTGAALKDPVTISKPFKEGINPEIKEFDMLLSVDGTEVKEIKDFIDLMDGKYGEDYDGGNYAELIIKRINITQPIKLQSKLLGGFYSKEDNYDLLASLRKNVNAYLKAMESEGLDEKFKEVYAISENLKKCPKDKNEWLKKKQQIEKERLAKIIEQIHKEAELQQAILASFVENMVTVNGGAFFMGNHDGWKYSSKYEKKHEVAVSTFKINKYEVSQKQWYSIMDNLPPYFEYCLDCPVAGVSWTEVQTFIKKLNELTGKKYRLPTEAEWEFTARGGTESKNMYSYKSNRKAMDDISKSSNGKVNEGSANELGIYCLISNVPEWCSDWHDYHYYDNSPKDNPKGPENGVAKILRGGMYSEHGVGSRDKADINSTTWNKDNYTKKDQKNYYFLLESYWGFRLAIDN